MEEFALHTLPASRTLHSITIVSVFCSHTIRQKSRVVCGSGPVGPKTRGKCEHKTFGTSKLTDLSRTKSTATPRRLCGKT